MFPMDTRTAAQQAADEQLANFQFPEGTDVPEGVELREGTVWLFSSTPLMDVTEEHFGMSGEEMTSLLNREMDEFFSAGE